MSNLSNQKNWIYAKIKYPISMFQKKNNFRELKKIYLANLGILDINFLEKVKFDKIEILDLSKNKISDIEILEKVNFKNLKKLFLKDNNIIDIKVLEKVKFDKLEILDLSNNKISNINILEKVDFKNLKEIILNENNITD